MDYELFRVDYTICGITYPDTLKILPASHQKPEQKFAVGDKNGILQCISIKGEEPIIHFKTLPGKPITCVQLTTGSQNDKIFAASGNEVKGYTRKGKVFLTLETAQSETITSMCVLGGDLIICSGRTVMYYRDLREYQSYICDDRVLDIAAYSAPNNGRIRILVLIANKGAAIFENGQMTARASIPSGPTRLLTPPQMYTSEIFSFYGASDGSIGLIIYEESTLSHICLVEDRGLGSVGCLGWYTSNGNYHLAVGRHDGSVQLYLVDIENIKDKPRLKFTYFSGEPVSSVAGGYVGTEEGELLVATFSGRIFALRTNHQISEAILNKTPLENLAARRGKLELEITRLEKQTANERDKYQKSTRSLNAGLSTPPLLDLQYEIVGAKRDGWQEIRITSAVSLDILFVYCNQKLDMMTDNTAVLSMCTSETASDLLATVRCQAGTRRSWIRMRNKLNSSSLSKLESTCVKIYILPAGAPRVARLISVTLPALSYYSKHEDTDINEEQQTKFSWCQLQLSGNFSVAEMTSWLSEVLPGDLPRPAVSVCFARSHALLGTVVICHYQKGLAVFKSNNISTIAVIRNILSNYSIEKNMRVEISCDIPNDYCYKAFKSLQNQYILEYKMNEDVNLQKALAALELDASALNGKMSMLCEDYTRMACEEEIPETYFDELVDIVVQWYADWRALSLHAENIYNKLAQLRSALEKCRLEDVFKILSHNPVSTNEY
ncbi:Bardet-Biedl syndrome 7 protein homolog isoform X2 [Manduca sexta]|uniref:Bardet-Biedl syndrome 7 protein homolog isoform X2 n=1 Tax=Manduca sexta TaxID=7130 RepID=UPI00188DEFD6|nr:Bardet-Biedl syndrome 7 protein homolog isoform X2 [Manduca sexta]